jgi:hypothetical protein
MTGARATALVSFGGGPMRVPFVGRRLGATHEADQEQRPQRHDPWDDEETEADGPVLRRRVQRAHKAAHERHGEHESGGGVCAEYGNNCLCGACAHVRSLGCLRCPGWAVGYGRLAGNPE